DFDCLFKAPPQDIGTCGEWDQPSAFHPSLVRKIKSVHRVKEELCAHPLVEVIVRSSESVERLALLDQFAGAGRAAEAVERPVPDFRLLRNNDADQPHHVRSATTSTSCDSTSSRSRPLNASASWARSNPYFTPTS